MKSGVGRAVLAVVVTQAAILAALLVGARDATTRVAVVALVVLTAAMLLRVRAIERRGQERLHLLRDLTRLLARAPDVATALERLLERTLDTFRGDVAEIVLMAPDERSDPVSTALERDGHVQGVGRADRAFAAALRDLLDGEGGGAAIVLERPVADAALDDALARRGLQRAVVAALPGEMRMLGALVLGQGASGKGFARGDVSLFGTLATHAAISLEHERLERMVAELRERQARLEHAAQHDALTGLANRARLLDELRSALASERSDVALLFLDLDDFKSVNDSLGHAIGDELLCAFARRLRGCLKASDLAARIGGDEFAVLLRDLDDGASAQAIADRIGRRLAEPFTVAGQQLAAEASIGVVEVDGHCPDDAEALLRDADTAMYSAKASGKRRAELFEPGMRAALVRRRRLSSQLRNAVERGELVVELQPIVRLGVVDAGLAPAAAEALVRWEHPRRGLMPAADFIGVAEQSGSILELDRFMLEQACEIAARWPCDSHRGTPAVHVNVSARHLGAAQIVADVEAALARSGLDPSRLVLELPGRVARDPQRLLERLGELSRHGVRLAVEAIGSESPALGDLCRLPVDVLKVDRSTFDDVALGTRDRALAAAIVELAHSLGMTVVGAGIERGEHESALRELGCDLGQGFWISPSVSPATFAAMLDTRLHGSTAA